MTPTLFDLPIRTGEAAALANLVLEVAGGKPLTDDLRSRIAARSGPLRLENLTPYFGSLERDPIHPAAVYIAIDGIGGQPLLLRLAPATTPSSGLFPKSILIGRVPGPKGVELVINALPFGPADHDALRTFGEQVNTAFLPRAQGNRSAIVVAPANPPAALPAAFDAFRVIQKARGINFAGVAAWDAGMWAAIRTGWREGFTAEAPEFPAPAEAGRELREQLTPHLLCSQFTVDAASLDSTAAAVITQRVFEVIREMKTARKTGRSFDVCVKLRSAEHLGDFLAAWRDSGRALALVKPASIAPDSLAELAAAALAFQAVLAIDGIPPVSGLRLNCRLATEPGADVAQEIGAAAQLLTA